jgi:hypothetical protein
MLLDCLGHDHTLQHLEHEGGLTQLVSGAGGADLYTDLHPSASKAQVKWAEAECGFMVHRLRLDGSTGSTGVLHTTVVNREGQVIREIDTPIRASSSS